MPFMLAKVFGCALTGLTGEPVSVEVDIASGLPAFNIVGLPDAAVSEAKERVRAAIRNAGVTFPPKRITVNLAPGDLRKEGTGYDLPIAVGILIASGQMPAEIAAGSVLVGELALNGDLRHVQGALPIAATIRDLGFRRLLLPAVDAPEAALVDALEIAPFESLADVIAVAAGQAPLPQYDRAAAPPPRRWRWTFARSAAKSTSSARWRSPPPAGTTSSCPGPRARARRCWRARCRASCPR